MYFSEEACQCKNQSPKKTSIFWKPAWLSIMHKIAIRLPFSVFPVFQANLQLVSARSLNFVLYLIGSDLLVKIYRVQRCPEQPNQQMLPQVQWKKFKMFLVHMKSLQAQTKNKTQKPTIKGTITPKYVYALH